MKKLILILIGGVIFSSCKKEEVITKKKYCKVCQDRVFFSSDKQKEEIVTSIKETKYCSENPKNDKITTSVMFDMQDPMHPMYRYETDCIDSTNIAIDTTNNTGG